MPDARIVGGDQNTEPIVAADVLDLGAGKALRVTLAGASGEQYPNRARSANFGRVNIGTTATQILASNANRLGFLVQNLEPQQLSIGFASSVTVKNGILLAPTAGSSGDGGVLIVTDYTGEVHGIVSSGDLDVAYSEFVK